ncbi:MAG: hypothetical protein ABFD14_01615 [Anaerolineaceae bacterium]
MRIPVKLKEWLNLKENILVLVICVVIFLIIILTTGLSPLWIYSGF